jgi:hypothetical protein
MTALHDIFTYALPATVFLFAAVVFLLLCAAAALWPWRSKSERTRHARQEAARDYARRAPSVVGP